MKGRGLDVAAGTGLSTIALQNLGLVAVGVDSSMPMLGVAAEESGPFIAAAAERLPFVDAAFDVLTVSSGLHWFDRPAFLVEARRVLVSDGVMILYDHGFLGQMQSNPGFATWGADTYLLKFPSPPRNAMVGGSDDYEGFELLSEEAFTEEVPLTREQLTDYLLTQSNTIAAVEEGRATAEEIRTWLLAELDPFYEDPAMPAGCMFWGRYEELAPGR